MLSFIAQRIVKGVIVLLAIIVLNFFLIRLAPGDPAMVMAGEAGASDQVYVAQLREKFGLNKPSRALPASISASRFASRCRCPN
jgi:peptide/nickel transport system permease protein